MGHEMKTHDWPEARGDEITRRRPVTLHVWATDEAFWKAHPQQTGLPAACYRVAMARARMLADDPNLTFLELG